jgi:hypothetical protein
MREDQRKELERIKDQAIDNAIAEFDEACGLTLQEKDQRGDRRWLTMMASSSLKLSADITRMLANVERPDDEGHEEAEINALIQSAQNRVVAFKREQG